MKGAGAGKSSVNKQTGLFVMTTWLKELCNRTPVWSSGMGGEHRPCADGGFMFPGSWACAMWCENSSLQSLCKLLRKQTALSGGLGHLFKAFSSPSELIRKMLWPAWLRGATLCWGTSPTRCLLTRRIQTQNSGSRQTTPTFSLICWWTLAQGSP